MPTPVSWTLVGGPVVTPAVSSLLATGTTELPPPLTSFTATDFLNLFDRLFPLHWLGPIKDPGPGYEVLQAYAKMMARASTAVCVLGGNAFITSAHGGSLAAGAVSLVRDSANALLTGAHATVSAVAGGKATITGLLDVTAAMVGSYLTLSDCYSTANEGSWLITDFLSSSSVKIANTGAVAPDGNDGNIDWYIGIPVTVKAGTVVTCSRGGQDFKTTADVTFYPGTFGPYSVGVVAIAKGYEWNRTGTVLTADGTVLAGDIDTIKTLIEDPPLGDLSIRVQHLVDTSGGADAALDQLGLDRGISRRAGEDDVTYRGRVSALPDTISPGAVARACKAALEAYGAGFEIIETWDIAYQTCWDAPFDPIAGSSYDPTCCVYDDPRPATPFRGRWMDESELRGCFIVVVDPLPPIADTGMVYDDTALNATALYYTQTGGSRAVGAWDVPSTLGFGYLQGCWDGYDAAKAALFSGLYQTLQAIKAAGVVAVIELNGE